MIALTTNVKLIIAGLVLASTAGLTYKITAWRYDARISKMVLEAAQAEAKAVEKVRGEERQLNDRQAKALNDALQLNAKLMASGNAARAELSRMWNTSKEAERRFASATQAAQLEYVATLGGVHRECADRYTEMGLKAQGHANDVRTLLDSWPVWREPVK